MYGPLKHYTAGVLDGTVIDPRFGTGAVPTQPAGWGGSGGGGTATAGPLLHVDTYGATADGRDVENVSATASSATVTVATAQFTPDDVGKVAWLLSGTNVHKATVTAQTSTSLTLSAAPAFTSSTAVAAIGTDNGAAIAATVTAALAYGQAGVQFGPGLYLTDQTMPALTYSRDFRIAGAGSGGMSYGYYTNMDTSPGTEVRYMGASGTFINASYTRGTQIGRIGLRYAHPSYLGPFIDLNHTWGTYVDHFLIGGVWNARGADLVSDPRTMESQFTDGMFERAKRGCNSTGGYNNASTYTRCVWLDVETTHLGRRTQPTFVGCVWEPTGGSMTTDPVTNVAPVFGLLNGATFIGCGWWDAVGAEGGWIRLQPGSSGIAIIGGYWEPRTANERLIECRGPGTVDGVVVHGLRSRGYGPSGSKLLEVVPSSVVTGVDFRGNTFNSEVTSGLESITAGVALEPTDNGTRTMHTHGNVPSAATLRPTGSQSITATGNVTVTFPTLPAATPVTLDVFLTQDSTGGRVVTWPSVTWDGGTAPTLPTTGGATAHLEFTTLDGGATWLGRLVGTYA